jgi:ABC-2 type transport system permease protein
MNRVRVFRASAALELVHLNRNRAFVALTALAAVSFLVMVSLFGLTGAYAPVALIDRDGGPYAQRLIDALRAAHHSFALRRMSPPGAEAALRSGLLVGVLTIPAGFSADVERGETVAIDVQIDNVNVDLTNDVQRALPAAIVDFGHRHNFPGLRARMVEHDVLPHDTGYIPYLTVSALALDAMLIAGVLGALATSREWEYHTIKSLRLSPAPAGAVLAGKLSVAGAAAMAALLLTALAMTLIYGVAPVAPWAAVFTLCACVAIFTCCGAWLGAVLKRTMAAVPLLFGLVMPLYIDSGALEPARLDGEPIWRMAHLSPMYYAVGVLEWAYHGIRVTPEPVYLDLIVLLVFAAAAAALTVAKLSKGAIR